MDNPFAQLLRPDVLAALTALPVVLQWAKKMFPAVTGAVAAVVCFLAAGVITLTASWGACAPACMALQMLYAWLYAEVIYFRVVEPMSTSSNPLVPDA